MDDPFLDDLDPEFMPDDHPKAPWNTEPYYRAQTHAGQKNLWLASQARKRRPELLVIDGDRDDDIPPAMSPDEFGIPADAEIDIAARVVTESRAPLLTTQTPGSWRGTPRVPQKWMASGLIPAADLTILSGNGGSGKTEIAAQLLISAAAALGDWLGVIVEPGAGLFLSCEEPEDNIRGRFERIAKHRNIDPYSLPNLHLHFPELDGSWLVSVDRGGVVQRSQLLEALIQWVREVQPGLVVIDSVAAVFDGDAIARRQVRSFLAILRKLARETGTAIVLLDHPSVRGMSDGSGAANSVDWRNSVRSMLHLSDPDKDDPDARVLELKKSNYGPSGSKINIRWNGLTFVPEVMVGGIISPYRAAAEAGVDRCFLNCLDVKSAQGITASFAPTSHSYAPTMFAQMPEAAGAKKAALAAAMERLLSEGLIKGQKVGSGSKEKTVVARS